MSSSAAQQISPRRQLVGAFDQLLELTWSEHQAMVAQLRRILSMERRLLDLCRCAGLDVPTDVEIPDLPEMDALPGGERRSTTVHGRWDGAFSLDG